MEKVISSLNYEDDIIQVKLQNVTKHPVYIAKIFEIISDQGVNIDMISQVILEDQVQIEFTLDSKDQNKLNQAIEIIKKQYTQIQIYQNKKISKICVRGKGMENAVGVAAKMFCLLGENGIAFYQVTTSNTSISCIIDKDKRQLAISKIKEAYCL